MDVTFQTDVGRFNYRVAGVLIHENRLLVMTDERSPYYYLPGGRVSMNEESTMAIKREIKEELDTVIKVDSYLDTIEYDYPDFHLSMDCFVCSIVEGHLVLKEHEDSKWIKKEEIDTLNWLPADLVIIDKVKEMMG